MKIITRLLPLAVLIGIVIGFKLYSKHNASEEFRPTAASFVRAFPAYEANKAYFDLALEQFHSKAFDLAYRLGGRRTEVDPIIRTTGGPALDSGRRSFSTLWAIDFPRCLIT